MSGTLTAAGHMWCMVEKAGTAPAKKTTRLLSRRSLTNATNATNATNKTTTPAANKTVTPVVPDAYADLRK